MRKIYISICLLVVCLSSVFGQNTAAINSTFLILNNGGVSTYYDLQATTVNVDFNGANLGNFNAGSTLQYQGAEHNVSKCGTCDITGTNLFYRVYLTSSTPGSFVSNIIPYFSGNGNGCGGQDQQWKIISGTVNLLAGLTTGGNYTIEVYSSASTTCSGSIFASNSGANYKATFNYCGSTSAALQPGNYPIPGCFSSIAAAVSHLNTYGVTGSGNIQFDVAAGYTETAPPGGLLMLGLGTAGNLCTGTATNQIIFKKTAGANSIITAGLQTATAGALYADGVFKIIGGDYITIDGFTMNENVGNTVTAATTNTMTEFGVGLFYGSTTNGAQNNTIQNCNITLNTVYGNTTGIFSTTSSAFNSVTISGLATSTAGTNSNNKIYSNTISADFGIYFICPPITASVNETGNDFGGSSSSTGNTITFGSTAPNSGAWYTSPTSAEAGIVYRNGAGVDIKYNNITSNSLTYTQSVFGGILISNGTVPTATVSYTSNISNNTINLTNNGLLGTIGIDFAYGTANATFNSSNNNITIAINTAATNTGSVQGIKANYTSTSSTISNNTISTNQTGIGSFTGTAYFINADGATNNLTIQKNTCQTPTLGNLKTSSDTYGISHNGIVSTSLNVGGVLVTDGNTINISRTGSGSNANSVYGIYSAAGSLTSNYNVSNNNITLSNIVGSNNFYGIRNTDGAATAITKSISNNTININGTNIAITTGMYFDYQAVIASNNSITLNTASATLNGIDFALTKLVSATANNNTFNLTSSSLTPTIRGIFGSATTITNGYSITNNTINSISASAASTNAPTIVGIRLNLGANNVISGNTIKGFSTGAGTAVSSLIGIQTFSTNPTINNNNIYNLSSDCSGATGSVIGIAITAGTTPTIYNNFISDLKLTASSSTGSTSGVFGMYLASSSTSYKVYYNTVLLGTPTTPITSTATNFTVIGIGTSNTASTLLDLRNNIVNLNVTTKGTGFAACINPGINQTAAVGANIVVASITAACNNNVYNINSGASNFLYVQGNTIFANPLLNGYAISGLTANTTNNIVNDPAFNTSVLCSKYKTFMATGGGGTREASTYTENNLSEILATKTFAPIGASYAENGAAAIATPSITTDYNLINRTPSNDIGALQFSGSLVDKVAPVVTYTINPNGGTYFCAPSVVSTILDAGTDVDNNANKKPRLYYKKSGESSSFGTYPTDNGSAFNGWKYVETISTSSPYSFAFDFSKLNSPIANNDIITYFVTAQDLSVSPNVGTSVNATITTCPVSVNFSNIITANSTDNFTYLVAPTSITTIAGNTAFCTSGSTLLQLSSSPSLVGVTYQWEESNNVSFSPFTNASGTSTGANYTTPNLNNTKYYRCQVYCNGTALMASPSSQVGIIITQSPTYVNLQSPSSSNICQNSSFTSYGQVYQLGVTDVNAVQGAGISAEFGYSTSNTDPSGAGWTWASAAFNPLGGGTNNDEFSFIFTPTSAVTHYYTYRFKQGNCNWLYGGYSATGGGFWTNGVNVNGVLTVNPAQPASVSIAASPSGPICAGTSVTFTATPTNGGTPTYIWKKGGVAIPGETGVTYTSSTLANGNAITVTMTSNATPCLTGSPATSSPITMVVNPLSTASVSGVTSPLCAPATASFTITGTPGETVSYTINGVAGTTILNAGTSVVPVLNATNTQIIVLSSITGNNSGCPASLSASSTVIVNPLPTVAVSNNGPRCAGTSALFSLNGTPNAVVTYNIGAGNTTVTLNASGFGSVPIASIGTTDVTLTLVSITNTTTTCTQSLNGTSIVIVNPLPNAPSVTSNTPICSGSNAIFTINGTPGDVVAYNINGGASVNATFPTSGPNTGTVIVTLNAVTASQIINVTSVTNTSTTCSLPLALTETVVVNPNVSASVAIVVGLAATPATPVVFPVCAGTSITFTANPTNGGSAPGYQWYNGATLLPGEVNPTYTTNAVNATSIKVVLTSSDFSPCLVAASLPATSNSIAVITNANQIVSVTITSNPAMPICAGTNVVFTATPSSNALASPVFEWFINGANTLVTTSTYSNTTLAAGDIVEVHLTSNATCATPVPAISNAITTSLNATGTWLGVNTDWNNNANWCGGVPTNTTAVTIPAGRSFYPVIGNTQSATCGFLDIAAGASVTVTGTGIFNLHGNITNAGIFDLTDGNLRIADASGGGLGPYTQISGFSIKNKSIKNLIVATSCGAASAVNDTLKITGTLSFEGNSNIFTTNDNLTLVSNAAGTASIGDITNNNTTTGNTITGRVEIQRYLRGLRAWRYLSTPVVIATSPTITDSWREGGTLAQTGYGTRLNGPVGPYLVTGPGGVAGTGGLGDFDEYAIRTSMKSYKSSNNSFNDVLGGPGFAAQKIANKGGYFLFFRGDRSVNLVQPGATASTLRIKGEIRTGTQTFDVVANKFESVGNPYPARIDMKKVTFNNLARGFYIWDPMGNDGGFNVGKYVYYDAATVGADFETVPPTTPLNTIESGQAFFVQSNTGFGGVDGSFIIEETAKTSGSANVSRPGITTPTLEINLHTNDAAGNDFVVDGAKLNFNNSFVNTIDNNDVRKIANTYDNLSIKSNALNLIVERRKNLQDADTIQLNIGGMRNANYKLAIDPSVLATAGVSAILKDRFLQTSSPVSLSSVTNYNFAITADAASKATDRFYIVFRAVPTVEFVSITATRNADKTVKVKYGVQNEINTSNYTIEHSNDGINFAAIGTQTPQANNGANLEYPYTDANATSAINWYRVKATTTNGNKYSSIAMVNALISNNGNTKPEITIYPNPIEGKEITIRFSNKIGKYNVVILNAEGKKVYSENVLVNAVDTQKRIALPKTIGAGKYDVVIIGNGGAKQIIPIVVL